MKATPTSGQGVKLSITVCVTIVGQSVDGL